MIGIIGGTGLYQMEGITDVVTREIDTPFGAPSAPVIVGRVGRQPVAFLPRHGRKHELLPGEINSRANIFAMKSAGVRCLISVSAVGSLSQEIKPGDLALPNQYLDFTKGMRAHTYFGEGLVAHVSTAEPTCPVLPSQIEKIATSLGTSIHNGKTYGCVEGPRLGNKAESRFLRLAGCHLVGMSNVPEVYLAREAQLCYCTIALVTDYDCWQEDPTQHASVDQVMTLYKKNIGRVQQILKEFIQSDDQTYSCGCRTALKHAILTPEEALSDKKKQLLAFLRE